MCLGDDANFVYDPVLKRYIFPNEKIEEEEVLKPPPMKTEVVQNTKPVQPTPEEEPKKEVSSLDSLLQPPTRHLANKRKNPSTANPADNQGFFIF